MLTISGSATSMKLLDYHYDLYKDSCLSIIMEVTLSFMKLLTENLC